MSEREVEGHTQCFSLLPYHVPLWCITIFLIPVPSVDMWGVVGTGSKVPEYKLVLWLLHKLHTGVDMLGVLTFITVVHRRSLEVLL